MKVDFKTHAGFESCFFALLSELAYEIGSNPIISGFDSQEGHHICWHGSTVEQPPCKRQVVGSIPSASSKNLF